MDMDNVMLREGGEKGTEAVELRTPAREVTAADGWPP
jgi:hypothetical protein